jgi:hypothetical protein
MKKILFILQFVVSVTLCTGLHAQTANLNPAVVSETVYISDTILTNISTTAIRDFLKRFNEVDDEHWTKITKGYVVFFMKDHMKLRADYDNTGTWLSTSKYLNESQIPSEIRDVVRSTYNDYSINAIVELQNRNSKAYFFHLEGKTKWKKIKVTEDEVQILENYSKG